MLNPAKLESDYTSWRLREQEAADDYGLERRNLRNELIASGRPAEDVDSLIESYERSWVPEFGTGRARWAANDRARREMDAAVLALRDPNLMTRFSGKLKSYRRAQEIMDNLREQAHQAGSTSLISRLDTSVDDLLEMQKDVVAVIRRANPGLKAKAVYDIVDGRPPALDAVRYTAAFALNPGTGDMLDNANMSLWHSLETFLNEQERLVLAEKFSAIPERDRPAAYARAYAEWANPAQRKPDPLVERIMQPVARFRERLGNMLNDRGFTAGDDIFARLRDGKVAAREEAQREGLRVPPSRENAPGHERATSSLRGLTDLELKAVVRGQDRALFEARRRHGSLKRRLASAMGSVLGQDFKGKDHKRELAELQRGRAAILSEQRRRAEISGPAAGPHVTPTGPNGGRRIDNPAIEGNENVVHMADFRQDGISARQEHAGSYDVSERNLTAPDGEDYGFVAEASVGDRQGVTLGLAATREAAEAIVDIFDRTTGVGNAANISRQLAQTANDAGMNDIKSIRGSGLLDERIDALIESRSLYAFAYPLKTGDVIFQSPEGEWRAATAAEFLQFASLTEDRGLQAAAEVVRQEVETRRRRTEPGRRRDGSPADASAPAARPVEASSPDPINTERSVAFSAGVEPVRLHPERDKPSERTAIMDELRNSPVEFLVERLEATKKALAEVTGKSDDSGFVSPADRRAERELTAGHRALNTVLQEKGYVAPKEQTAARPVVKGGDRDR